MAQFELLPSEIQKVAKKSLATDEEVKMCFLAGSLMFSSPDYVIITTERILVLDERNLGSLSISYVNVLCDVLVANIIKINLSRSFKNKIFGQANLYVQTDGCKHLINNVSSRDAKQAVKLLSALMESKVSI